MAKQSAHQVEAGDIPADIAALSFEAALEELDGIVSRLESGKVDLEESIGIYTRGAQLKRHCEMKLRAAEERIEKIVIGPDGNVKSAALDVE